MQSDSGSSHTDQIYNLYKKTVIQNLLHPQKVQMFNSSVSMNKIDEIEPEPEVEKHSPSIPFKHRNTNNGTVASVAADSAKVEDLQ